MIYKPEDIIDFGKNKGYTLAQIWKYEPTYISWLILNHDSFCIDVIKFKHLPKPTPGLKPGAVSGSKERSEIIDTNMSLLRRLSLIDSDRSCVQDAINYEASGYNLNEYDYWFSDEVIERNSAKIMFFSV